MAQIERTVGLYFKLSPEELERMKQKMEQAGTMNKRAYLRKMALDGYIIQVDMSGVKELVRLLHSVANNTNQIARRCNETHNLYAEDVEDLRRGYLKVQEQMAELVKKLAEL